MKKYVLIFLAAAILSCDDGELIVTDFNFSDPELQLCGTEESMVFFNMNNEGVNESIALVLTAEFPQGLEADVLEQEEPIVIGLDAENRVVYRTFDSEVNADYFCQQIPPVSPVVMEQYTSTSGGTVNIFISLNNAEDHDGDGVLTSVELEVEADHNVQDAPDTDGDGIANFRDIDDDNDNVLTSIEIALETENPSQASYPDTDLDGTPNYLDEDDDNDGTITRYEDLNEDLNPTNDTNEEGVPNYLNPEIVDEFIVDQVLPNTFSRSFRYEIFIENLTLERQGGDGGEIRLQSYNFGYFDGPSISISLPLPEEGEGEEENDVEEENPAN